MVTKVTKVLVAFKHLKEPRVKKISSNKLKEVKEGAETSWLYIIKTTRRQHEIIQILQNQYSESQRILGTVLHKYG